MVICHQKLLVAKYKILATKLITKINIVLATKNWWSLNMYNRVISGRKFFIVKYNTFSYSIIDWIKYCVSVWKFDGHKICIIL